VFSPVSAQVRKASLGAVPLEFVPKDYRGRFVGGLAGFFLWLFGAAVFGYGAAAATGMAVCNRHHIAADCDVLVVA
jgi:hypothetical protein